MNFGKRIKERRLSLGLTQEELAKKVGYSGKWTINKIESGQSDVSRQKISALATALKVSPSYLMGWSDEPTPSASSANLRSRYLLDKLDSATPEDIAKIEQLVQLVLDEDESR